MNQRSSRKKGCTGRRQHRARGLVASGAVLLLVLGADPLLTDRGWSAAAGPPPAGDPELLLRLEVQPSVSRRGETLALSLHATIPAGFKLYGMARVEDGPLPTRLALTLPPGLEAEGGWFAPDPVRAYDASFRKEVAGYREQVSFRRGLRLGPAAPGGALPLQLSFSGQICDEHRCLLQRRTLDGTVVAEEGEPRPELLARPLLAGVEQPPEQPPTGGGSRAGAHAGAGAGAHADVGATTNAGAGAGEGDEGLLGFLLVAFLAGLLALLTPCVFPMVPLTVSFFSRAAGESFGRVLRLAGTYAGSIVLTFTVAGMVISAVFGAAGLQSFAAHPLFNLAVASILVAFGLSLLGLFEIRVPSALIEASERWKLRFGSSGGSQGTAPSLPAVFFMALTFTLVSFSCTVAFLGVVLVSAAQGHWLRPALGMLSFSTAFALPFFLLALFPQLATRLQRQGGDWLELVKVLLGVLELAAALKFFSNVDLVWGLGLLPRSTALVLWLGLFTVAALYLLRFVRLPGDDGGEAEQRAAPRLGVGRLLLGVATIGLLFYLSAGLFRNAAFGSWVDGWLPPLRYPTAERADAASGGQAEEGSAPIAWLSTLDEGLRRARQDGRLLFLNFTGVTCTNCRYMEEAVLSRPEVAREIRRYVAVELFTDRSTPEDEANRTYQISTFRTAALPLYAVVTPEQRVLASFPGSTNDAGEFLRFLRRVAPPAPGSGAGSGSGAGPGFAAGAGAGAGAGPGPGSGLGFTLPRLLGGPSFSLSELSGRWVLLHHWASWCGPCRAELKDFFLPIAAAREQSGLTLVTAAFDGGDVAGEAEARAFARQVGLDRWPALLAPATPAEAGLPAELVPSTFPTTVLLDPQGRLVWKKSGELQEQELQRVLQQHLPAAGPGSGARP